MQNFTTFIGDSKTLTIPLEWEGAAFTPGTSYTLIFTVKAELSDTDAQAKIQKVTATGLTHSGSTALVALVPNDSTSLLEQSYFYDVQAQHNTTGAVLTVQNGKLRFKAGVTKELSSSIDIYTTSPPVPGGITIGTTPITSGTTTRILYNNAGVVGQYSISGTGSVAMTNSPAITTPSLIGAVINGDITVGASGDFSIGGAAGYLSGIYADGAYVGALNVGYGDTGSYLGQINLYSDSSGSLTLLRSLSSSSRLVEFPDAAGTIVLDTATQTLTNKTLTTPAITGGTQSSPTITTPIIQHQYAALAADQTTSSNTTLTDVTGLSLTLAAGTYRITGLCIVTPANSTMGIKIGFNYSGTGTMFGMNYFTNNNALTGAATYVQTSLASGTDTRQVAGGTNSQSAQSRHDLIVVVTATTTLKYQFAQHTSNGSNLTAEAGSYLMAERIA